MAELVQQNMEQMLPFLDELHKHVDAEKIKEIVRKRNHHEYKIASKFRKFNEFQSYVEDELNILKFIRSLKLEESKSLIFDEKKLIERIIKQVTIHFQSDPKAFLLAIEIMSKIRNINMQRFYWTSLLTKHGHRDVKFYLAAVYQAMHSMKFAESNMIRNRMEKKLKSLDQFYNNFKNKGREAREIKKEIKDFEKEKEIVQSESTSNIIKWTRTVYFSAIKEFPKNSEVFMSYLKFEINNYNDQKNSDVQNVEELGVCKDGKVIDVILLQIFQFSTDINYFSEIISVLREYAPNLNLDSLTKMKEIVAQSMECVHDEPMVVDTDIENLSTSQINHYSDFLTRYPQPKFIRSIAPNKAEKHLVLYLQSLRMKIQSGDLNKDSEMTKVRDLLDCILLDEDWSSVGLDVWWEYFMLEKHCGSQLQSYKVLKDADFKLKSDLKPYLTLRKIKIQR